MRIGMHIPFDGFDGSLEAANLRGLSSFQIFIRNNRNCKIRNFSDEELQYFNSRFVLSPIDNFVVHASYALNMASPDETIVNRTKRVIMEDMYILSKLCNTKYYVIHPGAYTESTPDAGMTQLIKTLHDLAPYYRGTKICVEVMAGAGTQLISTLSQIGWLIEACKDIPEFSICLDTCHLHGAGIRFEDVINLCTALDALDRLAVLHVNNTNDYFGSNKDRHVNVDRGVIPLNVLLGDIKLFNKVAPNAPIILETPSANQYADFKLLCSNLK